MPKTKKQKITKFFFKRTKEQNMVEIEFDNDAICNSCSEYGAYSVSDGDIFICKSCIKGLYELISKESK